MKREIFALLMTALLISCNTAVEQEPIASKVIGYEIEEDGNKAPLYSGDMSNLVIWEAYIKAHNEQDLEAIKSMNADENFKVYAPNGIVIEGTEAHIEFLTNWFVDASPKWKMNYLIENEFTNKKGELRQWVTSGNQLTLTVDGKEVKLGQVNDALISNGKVQMFYVTERILATDELE
jgi:hypothetical protein